MLVSRSCTVTDEIYFFLPRLERVGVPPLFPATPFGKPLSTKESRLGPDLRHFHQSQNILRLPECSHAATICSQIL